MIKEGVYADGHPLLYVTLKSSYTAPPLVIINLILRYELFNLFLYFFINLWYVFAGARYRKTKKANKFNCSSFVNTYVFTTNICII